MPRMKAFEVVENKVAEEGTSLTFSSKLYGNCFVILLFDCYLNVLLAPCENAHSC